MWGEGERMPRSLRELVVACGDIGFKEGHKTARQ